MQDEEIKPEPKPEQNEPEKKPVSIDQIPFNPSMNLNVKNGITDSGLKEKILSKRSEDKEQ